MRKFYLSNENGERIDLQDIRDGAYLTEPSGLGFDNGLSYIKIGNSFQQESKELRQGFITGSITMNGYEAYQDFINFIEKSESLRLIYAPLDTEYYRDVDFDSITKTERSGHWIKCGVKFNCKSLYYTEDNKEFIVTVSESDCVFPFRFGSRFKGSSPMLLNYFNDGHTDGEILVEMFGFITRPELKLYVNDVLKSKMVFNITINEGQKLLYSAKNGNNYVKIEDVDGTQRNVSKCLSLESENFFKIPKGISTLILSSGSGIKNRNIIRVLTSYKGV